MVHYPWHRLLLRHFFQMCMLDVFDRAVVAYHIGLSCEAKDLAQITQEALMKRQLFDKENKPVVRSDNGPQFISHLFEEVGISFIFLLKAIKKHKRAFKTCCISGAFYILLAVSIGGWSFVIIRKFNFIQGGGLLPIQVIRNGGNYNVFVL